MLSKCLKIAVVQLAMLATILAPVVEAVPQRRCLSSLLGLGCICCRTTTASLPSCCARLAQVEAKKCCRQATSDDASFTKTCVCKSRPAQPVSCERAVRPDVRPKHWVAATYDTAPAIAAASYVGSLDHAIDSGPRAASGSLQSRLCRWLI